MNNGGSMNRIFVVSAVAIFTGLFCAVAALAADNSPQDNETLQRQTIEQYYKNLISDIQRNADQAVRDINSEEKIQRSQEETVRRTRLADDFHEERSGELLSSDEISELEQQRAQKEKDIRDRALSEIKYLNDRKARELENIGRPAEFRPMASASARGMVTGIVFYENKGAALILGEIVRENDELEGVRVLKVWPDYVEFEKQGKKWKQEVGQAPPAMVWEKPQPKPAAQPSSNAGPTPTPKPNTGSNPKPAPAAKSKTSR
jgi:hypothetical protein